MIRRQIPLVTARARRNLCARVRQPQFRDGSYSVWQARRPWPRVSALVLLFLAAPAPSKKTLKILQWSHFVPGYDKWFNDTYVKEWGAQHNTNVMVDNIGLAEINSRAAAEVAAQKGHDLFLFLSPPTAHEDQAIDHRDIYEECERK